MSQKEYRPSRHEITKPSDREIRKASDGHGGEMIDEWDGTMESLNRMVKGEVDFALEQAEPVDISVSGNTVFYDSHEELKENMPVARDLYWDVDYATIIPIHPIPEAVKRLYPTTHYIKEISEAFKYSRDGKSGWQDCGHAFTPKVIDKLIASGTTMVNLTLVDEDGFELARPDYRIEEMVTAVWTGYGDYPPNVGDRCRSRVNGIGWGTVTSRFIRDGFWGVMMVPDLAWTGNDQYPLEIDAFGKEIDFDNEKDPGPLPIPCHQQVAVIRAAHKYPEDFNHRIAQAWYDGSYCKQGLDNWCGALQHLRNSPNGRKFLASFKHSMTHPTFEGREELRQLVLSFITVKA
jgi:hypothetical protein